MATLKPLTGRQLARLATIVAKLRSMEGTASTRDLLVHECVKRARLELERVHKELSRQKRNHEDRVEA